MDKDAETNNEFDQAFAQATGESAEVVAPAPAPEEPQPAPASAELEQLRLRLADAEHRAKSDAGRIRERDRQANAMQAQLQELQARLQELNARAQPPAPAPSAEPDVLDGADDLRSAVERRIEQRIQPLTQQLTDAQKRASDAEAAARAARSAAQPLLEEREERTLNELSVQLDQEFGGWKEQVKSQAFQDWLNSVPTEVQSMYQRANSFDVAARVLRLYSADTGQSFARRQPDGASANPNTATTGLRNAVGIRPGVAGVSARPNPNDFDNAFSEFATKKVSNL